ncbi:nucleoside recognition domain-containing protein [Peribacillus kribbensis]|uniref:nucleoside recognition domain-containing protein n=1 Tax=Peribacillus kribbensis TaxID=356658 RepID=UPI000556F92F|nr:nucleoside recognition domain-containing protein [Peribacillus kribbensis]
MIKRGLLSGLGTVWTLGKVIFPVTLIVSILQYTPVLNWIVKGISPAMKVLGLPGEAAIPLVLGNFLNLYAAIGGVLTLHLTVKEVLILAVMLSFCHNLLIETSVALKVGVKLWVILTVRISLALISAIVINLVWHGGGQYAQYGSFDGKDGEISGAASIVLHGIENALHGIWKLAIIVIPLMVVIQIMKELKWMDKISSGLAPLMKILGMQKNASMTMATGLVLGLAYGAGVMIQAVQEDGVSKKDATLAFIFLVACHAVVEDTLIFVPLGVPVWALFLIRIITAFILTMAVSYFWKRAETAKLRKETIYEHI